MYCSGCGFQVENQAVFCSQCGRSTAQNQPQLQPTPAQPKRSNPGLGFGISSLIIGILTLSYGFIDYDGISSGGYSYIYYSEIGLLLIMSIVGVVFGGLATRVNNAVGKAGLGVSVAALLFTLFLAQYGG